MTQIVSSISGIEIYAPSAGNAPTNSSEVSAIASAYQVVSATATQLYAGTSFLTSVNSTPVSASRAGNAANASLATSAWYDGTGRFISALPDKVAVSSIASGYVTGVSATVANNSASWGGGGGSVVSPSGTIVVMNGNEVEGTNSAAVTGLTGGYNSIIGLIASVVDVGPSPVMLSYDRLADGYTGGNFALRCNSPIWNTVVFVSGRDTAHGTASASASAVNGDYDVLVPQGPMVSDFMAWTDGGWIHVSALEASAAPSKVVTDIGELAWNSALTGVSATVANNSASWGQGGVPASTVSSIASSYAESAVSSKADSSSLSSYALSADVSGTIDTVSANSASWAAGISFPYGFQSGDCSAVLTTGFFANTSRPSFIISSQDNVYPRFIVRSYTGTGAKGSYYLSDAFEFTTGTAGGANSGTKVLRIDPQQVSSKNFLLFGPSGSNTYGILALRGADNSAYVNIGSGTVEHVNYVRPSSISSWWNTHDTVSANSASWGQGGVDSATVSSIASSYAQDVSAAVSGTVDTVSSQSANWGGSALALSAGPGVKLEKVGDTLVAGLDETVLWSGSSAASVNTVFTLGESYTNFERIRLSLARSTTQMPTIQEFYVVGASTTLNCMIPIVDSGAGSNMYIDAVDFELTDQYTFTVLGIARKKLASTALTTESDKPLTLFKIVGINRTAGV